MSRYIDADIFIRFIKEKYRFNDFLSANSAQKIIDNIPTADVQPVVHAHNESETSFMCSNCTFADFGLFNHGGKYTPKYCPNCGAKMDEKEGKE